MNDDVTVRDAPDRGRFEALLDDRVVGYSQYRLRERAIEFLHTEVADVAEGMGVGSRLVRGALDAAREDGLRVVPRCPFVASYIDGHPEYADLVAS